MNESVQRIFVWPGWWRLLHLALMLSVTLLLLSGWVLGSGMIQSAAVFDLLMFQLHIPAGYTLGVILLLRGYFFVADSGVGAVRALVPTRASLQAAWLMIKFYISFARTPLPGYFSHNPLWAPIYLLTWLLLLIAAVSGFALEQQGVRQLLGFELQALMDWHQMMASALMGIVFVHLLTVVLQDVKGEGGDVSAIISGFRTFPGTDSMARPQVSVPPAPTIDIKDIGKL